MMPSISRLPLWYECQCCTSDPSPPGEPARFGSALGECAEHWCKTEHQPHIELIASRHKLPGRSVTMLNETWKCLSPWLRSQLRVGLDRPAAEVAWAVDILAGTSRELGRSIGRSYKQAGALDHEVCGSADLLRIENDRVWIRDLKTGRGPWQKYKLQVEGYAVAACLAYGKTKANVGIVMCRKGGWDAREQFEFDWDMDVMDLSGLTYDLKTRLEAMANAEPKAGSWCDAHFCGSKESCSAYQGVGA